MVMFDPKIRNPEAHLGDGELQSLAIELFNYLGLKDHSDLGRKVNIESALKAFHAVYNAGLVRGKFTADSGCMG